MPDLETVVDAGERRTERGGDEAFDEAMVAVTTDALSPSSTGGDLLDILEHPNPDRYTGQRIFVARREAYVYLVPFVEDEHTVFQKTIIPSRKATKEHLGEEADDED